TPPTHRPRLRRAPPRSLAVRTSSAWRAWRKFLRVGHPVRAALDWGGRALSFLPPFGRVAYFFFSISAGRGLRTSRRKANLAANQQTPSTMTVIHTRIPFEKEAVSA